MCSQPGLLSFSNPFKVRTTKQPIKCHAPNAIDRPGHLPRNYCHHQFTLPTRAFSRSSINCRWCSYLSRFEREMPWNSQCKKNHGLVAHFSLSHSFQTLSSTHCVVVLRPKPALLSLARLIDPQKLVILLCRNELKE